MKCMHAIDEQYHCITKDTESALNRSGTRIVFIEHLLLRAAVLHTYPKKADPAVQAKSRETQHGLT